MEPNTQVCYKKEKCKNCFCQWLIIAIVAVSLAFFIGVLVAAQTAIIDTLAVGGIIALIIAFSVLLAIAIVNIICCKKFEKNTY